MIYLFPEAYCAWEGLPVNRLAGVPTTRTINSREAVIWLATKPDVNGHTRLAGLHLPATCSGHVYLQISSNLLLICLGTRAALLGIWIHADGKKRPCCP